MLNKAIRKYGGDVFKLTIVEECENHHLNDKEAHYIREYNTIKPHGYNLSHGGASEHLDETKMKISIALKGRQKSHESLLKRSITKKGDSTLPMYLIECRKNGDVRGYRVTHPRTPEKRFCNAELTLAENLQNALKHLSTINSMVAVQRPDGDGSRDSENPLA